jgi:beta-barrel assembly-enhancing protease
VEFDPKLPAEGFNTTDENPLREFALLVAGVIGAVLALIAIAALTIDRIVPLVSPGLEARWFGGFAEAVAAEEDPRVAPLQALLDRLVSHWNDAPYPFRGGVLDEPDPNALALPGGAILVTTGLLDQVASENELALVLGHELGHFRARDHLRGLGRGLAAQLVLGALGGSGEIVSGLSSFAGALAQRGFDRRQESQADAFGLSLVHAEYGHVAGARDFFARVARSQRDAPATGRRMARYLDTHPLHEDRADALVAEAAAHGWATEGPLTPWIRPAAE